MSFSSSPSSSALAYRHRIPVGSLPAWLVILLGLVTAIGPLATDMYLPAFPALDSELGGGPGSAQITLAAWFAGLAIGQFSQGPLSDRLGRRVPLLGGLTLFSIASAGCALSTDYHMFCVWRFLGALGGSASVVVPRAIVRDIATGAQGARIMAQLTLVFGLMPILAPSLGSLVLSVGHWRWIFWFGTLYGMAGVIAIAWTLPDTLPRERRIALSASTVLWRYVGIAREPMFLSAALLLGFSAFVMFAYLASAPILFEQILSFTPQQFGLFFGMNAALFIAGAQINGRLVHRVAPHVLMQRGVVAITLSAGLFLTLSVAGLAGPRHPLLVCAMVGLVTGSLGFVNPNATVLAFTRHGHHAGSASALLGTLQFTIGSLSGVLLGYLPLTSAVPVAATMAGGVAGMLGCMLWHRRHAAAEI
ncbi:multidrug effflux MFS transporter [Gluconacetobacter sp. 1b LMG 1731]|uniref:Bcr/CflA family efflux transporter n=1 Tax=Gluconacetobacter dulcium TaxID=2729096 RepID=A0A7W4IM20_9PROT|nr:multidrug effflux MFS transporter [Gluconacetobacter dulcium]MBB2165361.1 multidrug effflux MFS transporter [Gluconacetobacter dulcium]MBB2194472.1 multidrug effflux MFS transporter [Gluconacetobacter dulcium]